MNTMAREMNNFVSTRPATAELAALALDLRLETTPPDAIKQAKRLLIDAVACMLGGYHSPTGIACRTSAREMGSGAAQASIIGSSERVACPSAVIANQGMLRYLDYNDDIEIAIGPGDIVCAHPSGALPVAIAVSEWKQASGRQFLESMLAGYEVIGRLLESFLISLEMRSFHHGTALSYAGAAMAGKLLGLTPAQLVHAMGIGGSASLTLGILDAEGEEYVMTKNMVDGFCAERGMVGAILARNGLTGPERIIEGSKGFAQVVLGDREKFRMSAPRERPFILETVIKHICSEATTHGHLTATGSLVAEHGIRPQDVKGVTILTNRRSVFHTGDPVKKYPRNKESADHSSYFLTAAVLLHGAISPKTYSEANYDDPRIRELIERVELVHDPRFDYEIPSAEVVIELTNGVVHRRCVRAHELIGSAERPMNDDDLHRKLAICTDGLMDAARVEQIIETCNRVEELDRFDQLTSLLVL